MRNKYMRRGVRLLLAGVVLTFIGWVIKANEWQLFGWKVMYGWAMVIGVILFGAGFLYVLYSLIRKVERRAILEERAVDQAEAENMQGQEKNQP